MTGFLVSAVVATLIAGCGNPAQPETVAPERSVPLQFRNDGITFNGTLWIPEGDGPHPAVILIGGQGSWEGARWYFDILRDVFRSRRVAVVYYDRRPSAEADRAGFEDLADDAIAVVDRVRAERGIDPDRVGLWGHSMGGWIAPLAASRSERVAFVITAAGPGVGPLDQTLFARSNEDRAAGIPEPDVIAMAAFRRKVVEYYVNRTAELHTIAQAALDDARTRQWYPVAASWRELQGVVERMPSPATLAAIDERDPDVLRWFRRDGVYDPAHALARLRIPYLAIFGETDPIVPVAESLAALSSYPRPALMVTRVYPGANHMIMTAGGQTTASLASGYAHGMAEWVTALARGEAAR